VNSQLSSLYVGKMIWTTDAFCRRTPAGSRARIGRNSVRFAPEGPSSLAGAWLSEFIVSVVRKTPLNLPIHRLSTAFDSSSGIERRERLGGMLNYYYRRAA